MFAAGDKMTSIATTKTVIPWSRVNTGEGRRKSNLHHWNYLHMKSQQFASSFYRLEYCCSVAFSRYRNHKICNFDAKAFAHRGVDPEIAYHVLEYLRKSNWMRNAESCDNVPHISNECWWNASLTWCHIHENHLTNALSLSLSLLHSHSHSDSWGSRVVPKICTCFLSSRVARFIDFLLCFYSFFPFFAVEFVSIFNAMCLYVNVLFVIFVHDLFLVYL